MAIRLAAIVATVLLYASGTYTGEIIMRSLKLCLIASVFLSAQTLSGCATLNRGTKEVVTFETTPSGAVVEVSNGMSCSSPCALALKRDSKHFVVISKPNYEKVTLTIISVDDNSGASTADDIGNAVAFPIVGVVVDTLSGANRSLKPNPVRVSLTPK